MLVGRVDGGAAVVAPVLLRQLLDEEGGGRLPRLLLRVDPAIGRSGVGPQVGQFTFSQATNYVPTRTKTRTETKRSDPVSSTVLSSGAAECV